MRSDGFAAPPWRGVGRGSGDVAPRRRWGWMASHRLADPQTRTAHLTPPRVTGRCEVGWIKGRYWGRLAPGIRPTAGTRDRDLPLGWLARPIRRRGWRQGPNALVCGSWFNNTGIQVSVKADNADFLVGSRACLRGVSISHDLRIATPWCGSVGIIRIGPGRRLVPGRRQYHSWLSINCFLSLVHQGDPTRREGPDRRPGCVRLMCRVRPGEEMSPDRPGALGRGRRRRVRPGRRTKARALAGGELILPGRTPRRRRPPSSAACRHPRPR